MQSVRNFSIKTSERKNDPQDSAVNLALSNQYEIFANWQIDSPGPKRRSCGRGVRSGVVDERSDFEDNASFFGEIGGKNRELVWPGTKACGKALTSLMYVSVSESVCVCLRM